MKYQLFGIIFILGMTILQSSALKGSDDPQYTWIKMGNISIYVSISSVNPKLVYADFLEPNELQNMLDQYAALYKQLQSLSNDDPRYKKINELIKDAYTALHHQLVELDGINVSNFTYDFTKDLLPEDSNDYVDSLIKNLINNGIRRLYITEGLIKNIQDKNRTMTNDDKKGLSLSEIAMKDRGPVDPKDIPVLYVYHRQHQGLQPLFKQIYAILDEKL